jgi:hypothetical protein
MTAGYALNIKRLYGPAIVRAAAKHLLRELAAELGADSHIDPMRIADNFILRGPDTAAAVATLAKELMEAAGISKCRKGAVTCLELLFTLPAATTVDPRQYFERAITWAEQHFKAPVLSCATHMDEGSPHAHALLLPLIDGHMVGSDLHGGKAKLAAMQTSFHESVGAPHGLPKYVPQKRLSATVRTAAIALARSKLQANAALNDDIIDALLFPHTKDPAPLLEALGIPMPTMKGKDFASLMTAVCKPEKLTLIGKAKGYPLGKQSQAAAMSSFPDSCVGKGTSAPSAPGQEQPPNAAQRQPSDTATGAQIRTTTSAPSAQPDEIHRLGSDGLPPVPEPETGENPEPGASGDIAVRPAPTGERMHAPARSRPPQSPRAAGDFQRQRDSDFPADAWDEQAGEFRQSTGPP